MSPRSASAPSSPTKARSRFDLAARWTAHAAGSPAGFAAAVGLLAAWLVVGPLVGYGDSWQLVINTVTTIVTFLMVFLIQATQNRDSAALQIKLDELIRATKGAHDVLLDLEELSEEELTRIRDRYEELAAKARRARRRGETDTGTPKVDGIDGAA